MNDMRQVIQPKSDQMNADDLIGGPRTLTITSVNIKAGEQPVSIHYDGDNGKPYKPCKSMCRVLVHCWGPDANQYVGKSLTVYSDPEVTWAGMKVGGIRISHMSHMERDHTMALTATRGHKKPFTVKALKMQQASPQPSPEEKIAAYVNGVLAKIDACESEQGVSAVLMEEAKALEKLKTVAADKYESVMAWANKKSQNLAQGDLP